MSKDEIADRIEQAMASLPDDLKATVKLSALVEELRGTASAQGGGNGNGPPDGP